MRQWTPGVCRAVCPSTTLINFVLSSPGFFTGAAAAAVATGFLGAGATALGASFLAPLPPKKEAKGLLLPLLVLLLLLLEEGLDAAGAGLAAGLGAAGLGAASCRHHPSIDREHSTAQHSLTTRDHHHTTRNAQRSADSAPATPTPPAHHAVRRRQMHTHRGPWGRRPRASGPLVWALRVWALRGWAPSWGGRRRGAGPWGAPPFWLWSIDCAMGGDGWVTYGCVDWWVERGVEGEGDAVS